MLGRKPVKVQYIKRILKLLKLLISYLSITQVEYK